MVARVEDRRSEAATASPADEEATGPQDAHEEHAAQVTLNLCIPTSTRLTCAIGRLHQNFRLQDTRVGCCLPAPSLQHCTSVSTVKLSAAIHSTTLSRHACLFPAFDLLFILKYLYLFDYARITHTDIPHHLDLHSLALLACTPTHTMRAFIAYLYVDLVTIK